MKCIYKISISCLDKEEDNVTNGTLIMECHSSISVIPPIGLSVVFMMEDQDDEVDFNIHYSSAFYIDRCTLLVFSEELIIDVSNSDTRQIMTMDQATVLTEIYEKQCGFSLM